MRNERRITLAILLVVTAACSEEDVTAPPAPWVDPVISPTSQRNQVITGSAEYGATVTISGGVETMTLTADHFTAAFRADVELLAEAAMPSGNDVVTVTLLITATDSAGNESEATAVEIDIGPEPGVPASLTFALDATTVTAGEAVGYTYSVVDGYGEPADAPVLVTTTSPGAIIVDDGLNGTGEIFGITRIGTYSVSARVPGSPITTITEILTVDYAAGERFVALIPSVANMATGDEVVLSSTVHDLYGNLLASPTVVYAVDTSTCSGAVASCVVEIAVDRFQINEVGIFAITATYSENSIDYTDTAYIAVQPTIDVYPPMVSLENVQSSTLDCSTGVDCIVDNNDDMFFDVVATDAGGLSEVRYAAYFATSGNLRTRSVLLPAGTTNTTVSFTFGIPGGASFEDVELVAQAIDVFGNIANSASFTIMVRPINPITPGGNTVIIAGISPAPGANVEGGVRDANGDLIVIDSNNELLFRYTTLGTAIPIADFNGNNPRDLVADANGFIYVSVDDNNNNGHRVYQIDVNNNDAMAIYADFGGNGDIDLTANFCEAGNGGGDRPESLAILPVARGKIRLAPNQPNPANVVTFDDGTTTTAFNFSAPGSLCGARTGLAGDIGANFPGVYAAAASCQNGTYGDVELLADATVPDGLITVANTDSDPNVAVDSPIARTDTLFIGSNTQFAVQVSIPSATIDGDTCYNLRHSFGGGNDTDGGIAPTFENDSLVIYTGDTGNDRILRLDVVAGTQTTVADLGGAANNDPRDIVMAPSGCLIVSEDGRQQISTVDTRSCTTGCARAILIDGMDNPRRLDLDFDSVVASRETSLSTQIDLRARIPGTDGDTTPLATTSANISTSAFAGGAVGIAATGSFTVDADCADGDTLTLGANVYELDTDGNTSAGNIEVSLADTTPATVAAGLYDAIRQTEARLLVSDDGANVVLEVRPTPDLTDCF